MTRSCRRPRTQRRSIARWRGDQAAASRRRHLRRAFIKNLQAEAERELLLLTFSSDRRAGSCAAPKAGAGDHAQPDRAPEIRPRVGACTRYGPPCLHRTDDAPFAAAGYGALIRPACCGLVQRLQPLDCVQLFRPIRCADRRISLRSVRHAHNSRGGFHAKTVGGGRLDVRPCRR